MIADLVGLRADGHATICQTSECGNEKKICKIGLGNKVGSNCFKTNKYTYLKRDKLCIVQVFERAVSAPHANKEEVRSLLPANDSQPPSQTRTILEVMSQPVLN